MAMVPTFVISILMNKIFTSLSFLISTSQRARDWSRFVEIFSQVIPVPQREPSLGTFESKNIKWSSEKPDANEIARKRKIHVRRFTFDSTLIISVAF